MTLVPPSCWLLIGVTVATLGYNGSHKVRFLVVLALWGVFLATFVEEARSLARIKKWPSDEWNKSRENGRAVRVVSLNCGAGQLESAREIAKWQPDIVLLQESPSREQVEQLAIELFGDMGVFLYSADTAILATGQVHRKSPVPNTHFVHAEVTLPTGLTADVLSVRLAPPVFRLDFWMPGFWSDHRGKRIEHRNQITDLVSHLKNVPTSSHLIVGGDFNSPPYDDALASLRPRLFDTFESAGRGWGNTGTNDYPLFRVDQIWASHDFQAQSVTAERTLHSDHRMVVCDLTLED